MDDQEDLDFEESYERLEEIVDRLDSESMGDGDLSLDEALELYEEGVRLVRICQERLQDAEEKLEVLDTDTEEVDP